MRGEHSVAGIVRLRLWGSSPHARGTPRLLVLFSSVAGIIPACAGNTSDRAVGCRLVRDHPRMRGEHTSVLAILFLMRGSSPHARGTPDRPIRGRRGPGIIPACAGNTPYPSSPAASNGDHPRMRGEHMFITFSHTYSVGSSPHARGTHRRVSGSEDEPGIIPACAGNTHTTTFLRIWSWDHPRMRGEHRHQVGQQVIGMGSSPHARGTPCTSSAGTDDTGIIPACAGNTRRRWSVSLVSGDHPRMRGEHLTMAIVRGLCRGSSPHARGTLKGGSGFDCCPGIIPACAGNTSVPRP